MPDDLSSLNDVISEHLAELSKPGYRLADPQRLPGLDHAVTDRGDCTTSRPPTC